jgi:hypothetical protein
VKLSPELRKSLESVVALGEKSLHLAGPYLSARGLTEETCRSSRLGVLDDDVPGFESFRGRLLLPYITRAGVVDVRSRCIQSHDCRDFGHPKYLGRAGADLHIFQVEGLFDRRDYLCVAEGELDAIVLKQCGLPAVGLPGVSSWKPHYARVLEDYSRVYVFADGDEAGRKLGNRLAEEIGAFVVTMPNGLDVNDVMLDTGMGPDWLREKAGEK